MAGADGIERAYAWASFLALHRPPATVGQGLSTDQCRSEDGDSRTLRIEYCARANDYLVRLELARDIFNYDGARAAP